MKRFAIALFGLIGLVSAKPAFPFVPLTYATFMSPGAQIVTDAEALNNPEIVLTRTQHAAAARVDRERVHLAGNERLAAYRVQSLRRRSSFLADDGEPILTSSAPLGADGRVVDTTEVAAAKAAHAAAHANERLNLANEAARSGDGASSIDSAIATPGTVVADHPEHDGVLNTPEITTARIEHASEKRVEPANGRFGDVLKRIADDDPAVPLVLRDGVVAALVPVGAPLDTSEVADQQVLRDVKSVDALAVAGPILAYGRLIY